MRRSETLWIALCSLLACVTFNASAAAQNATFDGYETLPFGALADPNGSALLPEFHRGDVPFDNSVVYQPDSDQNETTLLMPPQRDSAGSYSRDAVGYLNTMYVFSRPKIIPYVNAAEKRRGALGLRVDFDTHGRATHVVILRDTPQNRQRLASQYPRRIRQSRSLREVRASLNDIDVRLLEQIDRLTLPPRVSGGFLARTLVLYPREQRASNSRHEWDSYANLVSTRYDVMELAFATSSICSALDHPDNRASVTEQASNGTGFRITFNELGEAINLERGIPRSAVSTPGFTEVH